MQRKKPDAVGSTKNVKRNLMGLFAAVLLPLAARAGEQEHDVPGSWSPRDLISAAAEVSYWFVPGKLGTMARVTREFSARDRFEGTTFTFGVNYLL